MELIDIALSAQQVHDLDILAKSLKYLSTFFQNADNKTRFLLNGRIVDKTFTEFERSWTPAALCMALARTTVPSLLKLPRDDFQKEYDSVLELKARLRRQGIVLHLETFAKLPALRRRYVLGADTFMWILEPSYGQ